MDRSESDLNALEARLASWRPAAPGTDRDRLIFLAGRSAGKAELRVRLVSGSAACLAVLVVTLGGLLVREQGQRRTAEAALAEATRVIPPTLAPVPVPVFSHPSAVSYLVLTHQTRNFDASQDTVAIHSTDSVKPAESVPLRVSDRIWLP